MSNVHGLNTSGELVIFSDVHIGAAEFMEDQFLEALKYCRSNNCKIILNGDIAENAIASGDSPGEKLLGQSRYPTDQVKYAMSKFKPFAKNGDIVGITRGNHEARTRRESMLDICDVISEALQIPYLGIGGYVVLSYGKNRYVGAVQHGKSAGANTWAELEKLAKLYYDAEWCAMGHNHDLGHRVVTSFGVDSEGGEVPHHRHLVRTGTYLGYAEYVRNMCAPPGKVGSPILKFSRNSHKISVDVSTLSW